MFYGCISTDIKKSSSNWDLFPEYMQKWVENTNALTESVVETYRLDSQLILPNAPEGDAYSILYTHHNEAELKAHLRKIANIIQSNLEKDRETRYGKPFTEIKELIKEKISQSDNEKEKDSLNQTLGQLGDTRVMDGKVHKFAWIGAVYLRIGLAITNTSPVPYMYKGYKSFRGGVIDFSEKAEENAPWNGSYAEYDDGKYTKVSTVPASAFPVDITPIESVVSDTTGFIIFVSYKYAVKKEDLLKDANLYSVFRDEFRIYHDGAADALDAAGASLVKVKRDSSSMFFLKAEVWGDHAETLLKECCKLVASLPKGSSVGIAYGNLKQVKRTLSNGLAKYDYFGKVVNMSARMEFKEFTYSTELGNSVPNSKANRVAYGDFIVEHVDYLGNVFPQPYTISYIPKEELNAGFDGLVYCFSKKLYGKPFKIGDIVEWIIRGKAYSGSIIEINAFDAIVERKLRNRKLKDSVKTRLLKKISESDESDYKLKF